MAFVRGLAAVRDRILAYHDRSDGGLWATLCELAFAGHTGVEIIVSLDGSDVDRVPLRLAPGRVERVRL